MTEKKPAKRAAAKKTPSRESTVETKSLDEVRTVARDAGTGEFVSESYAERHPKTTVVESFDPPADDPEDPEQNPALSTEHVEREDGMIFPAHGEVDESIFNTEPILPEGEPYRDYDVDNPPAPEPNEDA